MMQHRAVQGVAIGAGLGERFKDRMRRIRERYLGMAQQAGDDSPWFVLRVASGREQAVDKALKEAAIESLVPMRMGKQHHRRGRVIPAVPVPVMHCYVLVRVVPDDRTFVGLLGVEHVEAVLGGASTPRPIPHEDVRRFNALATGGAYDWQRVTVTYRTGERVRIGAGPFAGVQGVVVSCRADGRGDAVLDIEMFAGVKAVLVPIALLEKL